MYTSPSKFTFPQGDFLNAADLAATRQPFLIIDARRFTGKDMQGKPASKVAFRLRICDKAGKETDEVAILTLGSTTVRDQIIEYFATADASVAPIGLCYLRGEEAKNGKKLWVFADYADVDKAGVQVSLPMGDSPSEVAAK